MAFRFEDLEVYQRAERCLALAYDLAVELPDDERFNLAHQLRKAAVSVVHNIAESTERRSAGDAARFIQYALGSLVEVIACLRIGARRYRLDGEKLQKTRDAYEVLYRQLHAFRRSVRNK